MSEQEREEMKRRCGGSWKLVLRFLLAGEACCRREKSQAIAGPGHSIAVTSKGQVYTFGHNNSGQLGHGHTDEEARILPIRLLLIDIKSLRFQDQMIINILKTNILGVIGECFISV